MPRSLGRSLELLKHMWRVNHGMQRLSLRMERELKVTGPQRLALRCIGKYAGITAAELAELLHLDRATVSTALARLEARGLITRRVDPADRRRATIALTAAGKHIDRPTPRTVEAAVDRCLRTLDPEDLAAAMRVLAALAAAFERAVDQD